MPNEQLDDYFTFDDYSTLAWVCLSNGLGWSLMALSRDGSKARDAWDAMSEDTKANGPGSRRHAQ